MKKKFTYLSIFPDYFHNYFNLSIVKKSIDRKIIDYQVYNIRDFSIKGKVDDYSYGGGNGMVLKIEPFVKVIKLIRERNNSAYFIILSPRGKLFNQSDILRILSSSDEIVFICGRYEGIDARILNYVNEEISIGFFITMGGEIPALVLTDSMIRAIPGVIKKESYEMESFTGKNHEFLDFDCYTRPVFFDGFSVPEVLISGDHKKINKWKKKNMKKLDISN